MKKTWIFLFLILLVSASLLTLAASRFSFWEDETYIAAQAQKDLGLLLQNTPWDNHPVLPLITFAAWGSLFGYTELGLRSLSILASLITLLLTYFLALDLFDKRTALLSTAVLGVMPLFVMFAHNARYYPLSAMFSVLVVLSLSKFFSKRKIYLLALYIVFSVVLVYISFGAASVIAACNIWWLLKWLKEKDRKLGEAGIWILAQFLILGLYVPGFLHLATVVDQHYGVSQVNNVILELVKRLAYLLYTYAVGQTMSPLNPLAWIGCLLIAGLVLIALTGKQSKAQGWSVALILAMVIGVNLLMSFLSPWLSQIWQNLPHWSFYALPFLAIILGAGLARLKPGWAIAMGMLLFLVYTAANFNYFAGRQYLQTMYAVPWREIFEKIDGAATADTGIICQGSDVSCKYYASRFGLNQNMISAREAESGAFHQVWWVQTNLGQSRADATSVIAARENLAQLFPAREVFSYARQDDSIRWLKTTYLGQDDYEYRVEVHRFFTP